MDWGLIVGDHGGSGRFVDSNARPALAGEVEDGEAVPVCPGCMGTPCFPLSLAVTLKLL